MKRWMPFEWIAASRFLLEGRLQTLFIIGGVAIGVGVIVFMAGMLSSLEANFIRRVLTSQPHIQLVVPDQVARPLRNGGGVIEDATIQRPAQRIIPMNQWPKIRDQMLAMPGITGVSPTLSGSALVARGEANRAINLVGVDPATYFGIVPIPDYIVAGEARLTSEDIIIGTELAKTLGATVGDKLGVSVVSGRNRVLTIAGIVDLGNKGTNLRNTYVALRTAQSLEGMIGGVTTIDLTVADVWDAEIIAQQIAAMTDIEADSWIATNAQFYSGIKAQIMGNTMIRVFVALSVAFGIAAVLVVSVIQRSREIGILRAMGTSRGQILRVFLIQGGLLGFLGSLFGALMGAAGIIEYHAYTMQPDGTELFPLVLDRWLFIDTALLATLTGLLAALAPAVRAARLDPVVAIRG